MLWRHFVKVQGLFCQSSVKWAQKLNACNVIEDKKITGLLVNEKVQATCIKGREKCPVSPGQLNTGNQWSDKWKGNSPYKYCRGAGRGEANCSLLVMWFYKIQEDSGGEKKLEIIKEVNEVSIYKINIQKSVTFFSILVLNS